MERMALSHPEIAFKFISNRDTKLHTSGNCNLKDIIYSIYGRDIASNLLKIDADYGNIKITRLYRKAGDFHAETAITRIILSMTAM